MKSTQPTHSLFSGVVFLVLVLFLNSCSNLPKEHLEALDSSSRIYNNALESKGGTGGSDFVKKDMRSDYVLNYVKFRESVSIEESQIIDTTYLKDGEPVEVDKEDPDKVLEFNQAVITLHYRFVKMPDNRLQDMIHKQNWFLKGKRWEIEPDLSPFLD